MHFRGHKTNRFRRSGVPPRKSKIMTLIRSYTINNLVPLVPLTTFYIFSPTQTVSNAGTKAYIPPSSELSPLEDTKRLLFSEKARIVADLA